MSAYTILITGFGPFPGVPVNVSALVAKQVGHAARKKFRSTRIVTATLPTEWDIAPERTANLICDLQPKLALHFGVSDQARGFVIETQARNTAGRVDAAGMLPMIPMLDPLGPNQLPCKLPAGRIHARLQRLGLPARLSRDAGSYLCNAVFYQSIMTLQELGLSGRSGFIHLPVTTAHNSNGWRQSNQPASALNIERATRGGLEIIAACLNR